MTKKNCTVENLMKLGYRGISDYSLSQMVKSVQTGNPTIDCFKDTTNRTVTFIAYNEDNDSTLANAKMMRSFTEQENLEADLCE